MSHNIFKKATKYELRVNNYNPACLKAWRANMDMQFILYVYACALYIVSYIFKVQKGWVSYYVKHVKKQGKAMLVSNSKYEKLATNSLIVLKSVHKKQFTQPFNRPF